MVPRAADVLRGHPAISRVLIFDKNGADRGVRGLLRMSGTIRSRGYDCALIPHRSLRSALLAFLGGVPSRIGFNTSAGKLLLTSRIPYNPELHEISRNMRLLAGAGISVGPAGRRRDTAAVPPPRLHPSEGEKGAVDRLLAGLPPSRGIVCLAPGTVWNTKRWMEERFTALSGRIAGDGYTVALIGGADDSALCSRIASGNPGVPLIDASGRLSALESAELVGRAALLVCNDSAPLHIACAMNTPVVAIFGATAPGFGFGPIGPRDRVVETAGLACRPCSIHGGRVCPVGTFDCMERISVESVHEEVRRVLSEAEG